MIGSTHEVCQDYATSSGSQREFPYAIISDGCSSSKKSQIGAMLLSELAASMIDRGDYTSLSFLEALISKAETTADILGQDLFCLDATILGVRAEENTVTMFAAGDGYIVERWPKGMRIYKFTSPSGYPNYLSYKLTRRIENIEDIETFTRLNEIMYITTEEDTSILKEGIEYDIIDPYINLNLRHAYDYHTISVLSDGAGDVVDSNRQKIDDYIILKELTDFKSTSGKFVQRRLNGFKKKAAKEGWSCQDDISIATISLQENKK
jgi:hypothetical protein